MFSFGITQKCEKCGNDVPLSQYTLKTRLCNNCIGKIKNEKKKFQKILSLDNLVIEIIPIYDGHSTSSIENGIRTIEYNYNHPKYELIHELGHFLLSEKVQYMNFVSQPPSNSNEEIFYYSNSIIDGFVDFNCLKIDYNHSYYIRYIKALLPGMINIPKQATLSDIIQGFLKFFISINYLIKIDEKKKLQEELINALENLKRFSINQSIIMYSNKKRLNQKNFRHIEAELSNFENVKETLDYQTVIKFIYDVLRLIPFISENLLGNQISLIYPL
ncbi:hypothetical protein LCGC14_0871540 [marine sediment metagenome]|uniref:Uncharacterized protein n=1 Tax=marine sediment metagenome TaxID=412755 RepID=A0A0F9RP58_9ZZZZ|nr:hypothetical protein [bacterium]